MANTVLWARNPNNYIREVVAGGVRNVCWDWGLLYKRRIDPFAFSSLWYPQQKWRSLAVARWGSIEMDPTHPFRRPLAVHPTWHYGEKSFAELEQYIERGASAMPIVDYVDKCWRPKEGPTRKVVITGAKCVSPLEKSFFANIAELQREHPECDIHIHGLYKFELIVGGEFSSADFEVRTPAAKGKVILPNGKIVTTPEFSEFSRSFARFGYTMHDLAKSPSKRCIFNVKSHVYAAENWNNPDSMTMKSSKRKVGPLDFRDLLNGVELSFPKVKKAIPANRLIRNGKPLDPMAGDKFYCDSCSYSKTCRLFRTGSICAVPDSESDELARHFKTRNSDLIIEGLGKLMEGNVERYVDGKRSESATGELDPHVTRIAGDLFKQGVQLAKLVDPSLRTSAVAVNIGANQATVSVGGGQTKQQLAAYVISELEAGGVPRKHITEDLVYGAMATDNLGEYIRKEAVKFALPEYVDVEEA